MKTSNRLLQETSPYLQQHAHNPVDWYPWGPEALARAKEEDKPILVSIGYSACHWCHVMERESFEDEQVAQLMNAHFVNIKIDREERPDLDHIYMDAVQAMTGSGGWPLNVFLTPEAKPFYGGTYFPPSAMHNRPSWTDVLAGVIDAFSHRKEKLLSQADSLTEYLVNAGRIENKTNPTTPLFTASTSQEIFDNFMKTADHEKGGFGRAPKFPQTFSIRWLLRYAHYHGNEDAKNQALLSINKMLEGGIYDQLGGGFARYSTDEAWLVPHFEKMLYDNALLLEVLAEAYQVTHEARYKQAIEETIGFLERELLSPEGGFYAALDADSEGVEGKYYVWEKEEIKAVLGSDADRFCEYYGVSEQGNWEGKNILHIPVPRKNDENSETWLKVCRKKLFERRANRIRPGLDNKILLNWNALANIAYSRAFAATGNEDYRRRAIEHMKYLLGRFKVEGGDLLHAGTAEKGHPAFLDDYAFLIQALIRLQEITGEAAYLDEAAALTEKVMDGFLDPAEDIFYYTHRGQSDLILRKKEIYDGATPSGNAQMAGNLLWLGHVFDNAAWKEMASRMVASVSGLITRYPGSFGFWAMQLLIMTRGMIEIVVVGEKINGILPEILHIFIPSGILQASSVPIDRFPLLRGKHYSSPFLIYVCEDYLCKPAVASLPSFVELIEKERIVI